MGGGGGVFTSNKLKAKAKDLGEGITKTGKKIGLGNTVSSALGRTVQGTLDSTQTSPGLMAAVPTATPVIGAVSGYQTSQADQTQKAMLQAEAGAKEEGAAMQAAETDKALQARLKARQEEIMLRQGMTQKSIFGTGKNQPGILG